MCGFFDVLKSGWLDKKTQRKRNRVSCALMVLSLLIYIGVNSTVNSIDKGVEGILYGLQARVLTTIYDVNEDKEDYQSVEKCIEGIREKLEGHDKIKDVFFQLPDTNVTWHDTSEYFKTDQAEVVLNTFFPSVLEYAEDESLKEPAYDEVIIPKYLYAVGAFDDYNYYDGDNLIGETIRITYTGTETGTELSYDFKITGTYDNIAARSAQCVLFVNPEVGREIVDFKYEEEKAGEEEFRQEIAEMGMSQDCYEIVHQYWIGISFEKNCDQEELRLELMEDYDIFSGINVCLDPELQGYFQYVIYVANIVSAMLLVIAVINIIISSLNEVKDRKWEYALKMAMGYKKRTVVGIFFFEKLFNMIDALVISVVLLLVYSGIATYAVKNLMPFWMKKYVIVVDFGMVLMGSVLVVAAALLGVLAARLSIRSIPVAQTLKAGD